MLPSPRNLVPYFIKLLIFYIGIYKKRKSGFNIYFRNDSIVEIKSADFCSTQINANATFWTKSKCGLGKTKKDPYVSINISLI